MISQTRIRNVKVIGILLVAFGLTIFFVWGLPPLWESNELDRTINCDTIMKCIDKPVLMVYKNSQGVPVYDIHGTMTFRVNYTFTVDRFFEYDIAMQTNRNDIKEMMFVMDSEDKLELLKNKDPNTLIQDAKVDQKFLNSTLDDDGVFHSKGIFSYREPTDLSIFVIIVNDTKTAEYAGITQKLITVDSDAKLDEIKNNFENRKTNKIVLGLTWVGVALAPLLLGGDLISRVVLRED